jgi:TetR/AcrR family transcriptional regulator, transcriptional repressor of aconitase
MPKLSPSAIEKNKDRIEEAAKKLFIKQGFHATSMRNIAARAGTSLGNVYNYYRTKEEILGSIISKYQTTIDGRLRSIFDEIDQPLEPESLIRFGGQIKKMVNDHHDFWLLMYIDVLEFENRHFRKMFEGLVENLRRRYASQFEELRKRGAVHSDVDPAVAFTAVYMQFFNYFLVEKLFGGNSHFGMSDEQVIEQLTGLYCRGLSQNHKAQNHKRRKK